MLGAVIGDIIGSRFEWANIKRKEFDLFTELSHFTDDSVLSLALAAAILEADGDYHKMDSLAKEKMLEIGRLYPNCGYGIRFARWLFSFDPQPYNSCGNGAAMRVSACGFAATSLDEAKNYAWQVTHVTHNHAEGVKGAEATASAIYLARQGKSIQEIRDFINDGYYKLDFTLDEIRPTYRYDMTCQGTVPQAITAFCEATGFEDAIRNAISIGGDSDTVAAITGGIAEAYYGIPDSIREQGLAYLDERLVKILVAFEERYGAYQANP